MTTIAHASAIISGDERLTLSSAIAFSFLTGRTHGLGNIGFLEPILFIDRSHQQVRNKPNHQQTRHDVEDQGIRLFFWKLARDLVIKNSVHYQRSYDAG